MPKVPGLVKGLGVTFRTMMKPAVTVQYPHEKEAPTPRFREDQLQTFAWKYLIPISLVNILVTGVLKVVF